MDEIYEPAQTKIASALNLLSGFWLMISPWIFGYTDLSAATWNSLLVGIGIAIIAVLSMASKPWFEGFGWLNFLLGFWLLFAPSVLQFNNGAAVMWNTLTVGAFVLSFAIWRTAAGRPIRNI